MAYTHDNILDSIPARYAILSLTTNVHGVSFFGQHVKYGSPAGDVHGRLTLTGTKPVVEFRLHIHKSGLSLSPFQSFASGHYCLNIEV